MKCSKCGKELGPDDLFCGACGAQVEPAPESAPPLTPFEGEHVVETLIGESRLPRLIITSGPGQGKEFVLKGDVRLGRETDNEVVLLDPKISRHHAIFTLDEKGYSISDLGSTNGTFVNGVRIATRHRLRTGDRIALGDMELTFVHSAEPRKPEFVPPRQETYVPPSPAVEREAGGGVPIWVWVGCLLLVLIALVVFCVILGALLYQYGLVQIPLLDQMGTMPTATLGLPPPTGPPSLSLTPPGPPLFPNAVQAPKPLYEDDFSNPKSGWSVASNVNEERFHDGGQYAILVKADNFFSFSLLERIFDDFALEVEATQVGGPNNNSYGVCVRFNERGFYRFNISGDGLFSIGKYLVGQRPGEEWVLLTDWLPSKAIKPGPQTNHIKVICQGQKLSFHVNGEHLASVEDSSFSQGWLGLFASTHGEPGTYIRFDNIQVWPPPTQGRES